MFRGKEIIPEFLDIPVNAHQSSPCGCRGRPHPLSRACFVQDVETYDVSPVDPVNDMAVRKRLEAFLSWGEFGTEAELPGPCLDGKEFK